MNDPRASGVTVAPVRGLAFLFAEGSATGTAAQSPVRPECEPSGAHDYDTVDRDLERLGMRIERLPLEAGVMWRLSLPRGESVEAWEPGNRGLLPPAEITSLLDAATAGKALQPAPPVSSDPGAMRLREMLQTQRQALLVHDPGARLGEDPANVDSHRVAAGRARAFLKASRRYVDSAGRRALTAPLVALGRATGPIRDLDVLLAHVRVEIRDLGEADGPGIETLLERLELAREHARRTLAEGLDAEGYRDLLARLDLPLQLAEGVETVPLERIAHNEFRRLAKAVRRLGKSPDAARIHELRPTLKSARYAAELSAPECPRGRRFLADATTLQALLGEHEEAIVAEQQLRSAVVSSAGTHSAFVAGRLAERQRARRLRVSETLPSAWKRLRRSGNLLA